MSFLARLLYHKKHLLRNVIVDAEEMLSCTESDIWKMAAMRLSFPPR